MMCFIFINLPVSFTDEGFNSEFISQPVVFYHVSRQTEDRQRVMMANKLMMARWMIYDRNMLIRW